MVQKANEQGIPPPPLLGEGGEGEARGKGGREGEARGKGVGVPADNPAVTLRGRLVAHSLPTFGSGNDRGQVGEVWTGLLVPRSDPQNRKNILSRKSGVAPVSVTCSSGVTTSYNSSAVG